MPWMFRPRVGPLVYRPSAGGIVSACVGAAASVTLLVFFLIAVFQR